MTRVEFTRKIVELLRNMHLFGEHPVIDFCKRSDEEQARLFALGLSKCDGDRVRSRHQDGKAMDIYFVEEGRLVDPQSGWEFWHKKWEALGGQPMIGWDKGHFE